MSRELESLLPALAPPAGGLARLQRTIIARQRGTTTWRWRWGTVAAAACMAVAVLAVWAPRWLRQYQQSIAVTAALREALGPELPAGGIRVANGAALEVPSGQDNVKLYWVQSVPPLVRRP